MSSPLGLLAVLLVMATVFVATIAVYYLGQYLFRRWRLGERLLKLTISEGQPEKRRGISIHIMDWLDNTGWGQGMKRQLALADLTLSPSEYLGLLMILLLTLFLAFLMLFGLGWQLNLVASLIATALISRFYLRSRRDHYIASFDSQMADVALLMSNSLKAGLSVPQSFQVVADKMERPADSEFAHISREIRLGLGVDEAIRRMLERLPSEELTMMMTTIMIQRQAGGNLAKALSVMSEALSARFKLRDEVRTMTAEARYTGLVLIVLPIAILALVNRMMEGSVTRFLSNPVGWIVIGLVTGLMVFSFFLISKITDIKV